MNGDTVRREAETISTKLALLLSAQVSETPVYKHLISFLPPDKVALYFEKLIKDSILYTVLDLCIARWEVANNSADGHREVVWSGDKGLLQLLQQIWPDSAFPVRQIKSHRFTKKNLRSMLIRIYRQAKRIKRKVKGHQRSFALNRSDPKGCVTVLLNEGIDSARRSDLFWLPFANVEPERVRILIEHRPSVYGGKRIPKDVTQKITKNGLSWVALAEGLVEDTAPPVFQTPLGADFLMRKFKDVPKQTNSPADDWIYNTATVLVREIDYWRSFFQESNAKIHVEVGNATNKQIAQNIALELEGSLRVGYQRSEFGTEEGGALGHHPDHICFLWNNRSAGDVQRNRNRIDTMVVTGFPFGRNLSSDGDTQDLKDMLESKNAEFTIALFDSGFWWGGTQSRNMNFEFYSAFLNWILDDPGIAVIVKSKKLNPLDQFPELQDRLSQAKSTGRWVDLEDPIGRLPSDASFASDISVGLGISSAVSEAIALGRKAIYCDLTSMNQHIYYQVGKDTIVFDDLNRLMSALKRYRTDQASEPGLGDLSNSIAEVDPFCDGRGNERIGNYIGWLLEGFDAGLDRAEAAKLASRKYATFWGDGLILGEGIKSTVNKETSGQHS